MKSPGNLMDTNMTSKLLMWLMEAAAIALIIFGYGYSIAQIIN